MDYPGRPDERQRASTATASCCRRPRSPVDVGRMAIGQDKLLVTPLQMATVAQTIGNGGVRMEPRLVAKVVDPDGRTVDAAAAARRPSASCRSDTAAKLRGR